MGIPLIHEWSSCDYYLYCCLKLRFDATSSRQIQVLEIASTLRRYVIPTGVVKWHSCEI